MIETAYRCDLCKRPTAAANVVAVRYGTDGDGDGGHWEYVADLAAADTHLCRWCIQDIRWIADQYDPKLGPPIRPFDMAAYVRLWASLDRAEKEASPFIDSGIRTADLRHVLDYLAGVPHPTVGAIPRPGQPATR
jgi:hypothetical protein